MGRLGGWGRSYTTVKKVFARFQVSKYVYVKGFKQHAFDPILLNRTTGYCHETFIKHCLCFKVFHLHHRVRKRLTVKVFLARNMNIEILTRHEISFKKLLEIAFRKKNGKSYREIETIVGCSRSAAFPLCKKFFKSRTVQDLLRVGRGEKFTKIF